MMYKYNNFILEKKIEELTLLLEGSLYSTPNFMHKLGKLRKQGGDIQRIANEIFGIIDGESYVNDKDIKQNFFDVGDRPDTVSFLMHNKAKFGNYEPDLKDAFNSSSRNDMKIGKIIKYICDIFDIKASNKDIEDFVNAYKAIDNNPKLKFKLVSGKKIAKYYSKKLFGLSGTLGSSCMLDQSDYVFDLYTKNPNKVKLLVYLNDLGELLGRALVWKLSKSPTKSKYFMDRIYTNFDSDVIKFKEFAKEKGWMYRYTNNSRIEDSVVFGFDGNKPIYGEIEVKLDGKFDRYPYLDTLKYLSIDKDKLYNVPKVGSHILMDHERHKSQKCYNCDGDVMTSDGLCFDCAKGYRVLNDMGIKFKIKD